MDGCIFCKIINGETPSYTVYENEWFKVILDAFPSAKGHMVVISKQHAENIFELDGTAAQNAMPTVKKAAAALKKAFEPAGINILQNNGAAAGQTVKHFHIHLIPRFENDTINIKWDSLKFSNDDFSEILGKIKL